MPAKTKQPLDAIDNYFPEGDDFDDPFASPTNSPTQSPKTKAKRKEPDGGLGIDEEVSIAKRARVPRVKLDETRLLSDKGIPALRRRAAQLKLKGKGHEFSDAARLLSFYQLWLDDLFPKAKFLDALAMVEKAGHKTTMHKHRMDWINEGKPKSISHDENLGPDAATEPAQGAGAPSGKPTRVAPIFEKRSDAPGSGAAGSGPDPADDRFGDLGDLYDATPEPEGRRAGGATAGGSGGGGEPDEDDLDALMAEAEAEARSGPPQRRTAADAPGPKSLFGSGNPTEGTDGGTGSPEDEDDLDALMAEAEAATAADSGRNVRRTGTGVAAQDLDDLDALMAEAESQQRKGGAAVASGDIARIPGRPEFADDEEAMAELGGLW